MTENIQIASTTDTPEVVKAAMNVETKTEAPVEMVTEKEETQEPVAEETSAEAAQASGAGEEEGGETEEPADPTENKPRKKGGFQKKIDKLSAKAQALEQEKEYWREQALRTQKTPQEKKPEAEAKAAGKPDASKFENHDEYVEALADWKVEQRLLAEKQKTREEALKEEFRTKSQTHLERVEKFSGEHDDFDEVVESVNHIPISGPVQDVILNSEFGPELMYELAKNPTEYARICKLSPAAAGVALGKIEARFQKPSEEKPTEPKVTKAPAPIKPVTTNSASASTKSIYDEDLSQADYERLRNQQLKKRK